jgi:hypothetical protein
MQRHAVAATGTVAAQFFPRARLPALMDTALAAIRSLALLGFVDPPAADAMWGSTRRHLLTLAFGRERKRAAILLQDGRAQ